MSQNLFLPYPYTNNFLKLVDSNSEFDIIWRIRQNDSSIKPHKSAQIQIMKSKEKYIVYWVKLEFYMDIYSEGYVGISFNTLEERKKGHYKEANSSKRENNHFHNALLKYGDKTIWNIVHTGLSFDEALSVEFNYRPMINIGWNSDVGGHEAVSPDWYKDAENKAMHSQRTSEATKIKIAEKDSPEERSKRAKEVWDRPGYRESREGLFAGENNSQYGKFGDDHPSAGHTKTKAGREAISKAQRGKTVSQETRDKLSATRIAMFAPQKEARLKLLVEERKRKKEQQVKAKSAGKFKGEVAGSSKVTDIQRGKICQRRQKSETYKAIAEDYPITLTGVRAICQDWGPNNGYKFEKQIGKSKIKKVTSPEDKTTICKSYANGTKPVTLAKHYDLCEGTIYSFLANWGPEHGVPYNRHKNKNIEVLQH